MKSYRLMFHAGALAVAIAIMAAPGLPARAADDPAAGAIAQADSIARPDSSALRPSAPAPAAAPAPSPAPAAAPTATPADTARLVPAPASDTSGVRSTPPAPPADTSHLAPAPAPQPSTPIRAQKERRARPARTRAPRVARAAAKPADLWAQGANWVDANFGYIRSAEHGAAPGSFGFAVGARHFVFKNWSVGLWAGFDQLGRFDTAKEYEWPVTLEIAKHFEWKTVVHPYLAGGTGYFRHQYRGTGDDLHRTLRGSYLSAGMNVLASDHQLLGTYFRYEYLISKQDPPNPIFDGERSFFVRYSLRLTYSLVF